ncbi:MAG: hypothetical protein KA780_11270, partial [Prolixibacteraceae bacterium]|nr:hypothetical protein [Prolixibacteraceae bacterium]
MITVLPGRGKTIGLLFCSSIDSAHNEKTKIFFFPITLLCHNFLSRLFAGTPLHAATRTPMSVVAEIIMNAVAEITMNAAAQITMNAATRTPMSVVAEIDMNAATRTPMTAAAQNPMNAVALIPIPAVKKPLPRWPQIASFLLISRHNYNQTTRML